MRFRKLLFLGMLLAGYGVSLTAKAETLGKKEDCFNYLTKEQLEELGFPPDAKLVNEAGDVRLLVPGEIVRVQIHAEDNSISFTTFDDYATRVPQAAIQAPRNVSGETGL